MDVSSIQEFLLNQGVGLLIGAIVALGLPFAIKLLRTSSQKKLTDKDPSNDLAGHLQGGVADLLDKNKTEIGKVIEKVSKKK